MALPNARYQTRCKRCGGVELGYYAAGIRAWVCDRCRRVALRITDLAVWAQIRGAFFPEPSVPMGRKPDRVYVLRRPDTR